jgi:hypothetical protein
VSFAENIPIFALPTMAEHHGLCLLGFPTYLALTDHLHRKAAEKRPLDSVPHTLPSFVQLAEVYHVGAVIGKKAKTG